MKIFKKIDLFKMSIGVSFLIVAVSVAYFMLAILPSQQKTITTQYSQQLSEKPTTTPRPTATPTSVPVKPNTLSQLNQCLSSASAYKEDTLTKLLAWAEGNNQNGEHNLTGAFDSIEVKYEQDRQDCFAKYPQ